MPINKNTALITKNSTTLPSLSQFKKFQLLFGKAR